MSCVVRFACGKTTANIRVDAAMIPKYGTKLGDLQKELRSAVTLWGGGATRGACHHLAAARSRGTALGCPSSRTCAVQTFSDLEVLSVA